ncbi:Double zinc ribbon [Gimesia maris]|nr:Double zinc ribbon [Gimesia maris]|tara:strand:+ start:13106 stop:13507 length:402 start_codon:yes stop_codon:yes gene_type:complete
MIICGIFGAIVGGSKDAGTAGFWLGLLFGPLGILVAFTLDNREKCLQCGSRLDGEAKVCPSCGTETFFESKSTIDDIDITYRTTTEGRSAQNKVDSTLRKCLHCGAGVSTPQKASSSSWKCPLCDQINLSRSK